MSKRSIIEAVAIVVGVVTLLIIYINLVLTRDYVSGSNYKPYEPFGYETSHDEYINNMPSGRYTKSGVRILPKNER